MDHFQSWGFFFARKNWDHTLCLPVYPPEIQHSRRPSWLEIFHHDKNIAGWWQLKCLLCSSLPGEMIPILTHIFQLGWLKPQTSLPIEDSWIHRRTRSTPLEASIYIGLGGGWPKSFGRRQKTLEVVFVHFWSRSHSRALSDLKTWRSFNKNVQRCKKSKKSGEVGLLLNYQLQSYMFGAHVINTCLICCMTASAICQLRPSLA